MSDDNNKIHFLDTLIKGDGSRLHSQVYHKPTDNGSCLNADGECPDRYKRSVVNNYLHRAYKFSENWSSFHLEVQRIKQVLVNNNYTNDFVDRSIKTFVDKICDSGNTNARADVVETRDSISLYYCAQMHRNYKIDEKVLRGILTSFVTPIPKVSMHFNIYYKNQKTYNLVIKNNCSPRKDLLQSTHLVYQFKCPIPHCKVDRYIGSTTTTLSRRLTMHLQNGSILQHFNDIHGCTLKRQTLVENVTVLTKERNVRQLRIKEALLILNFGPEINRQFDRFPQVLKLYDLKSTRVHMDRRESGLRGCGIDGSKVLIDDAIRESEMCGSEIIPEEVLKERTQVVPHMSMQCDSGRIAEEVLEEMLQSAFETSMQRVRVPENAHVDILGDIVRPVPEMFPHLVGNINITIRKKRK